MSSQPAEGRADPKRDIRSPGGGRRAVWTVRTLALPDLSWEAWSVSSWERHVSPGHDQAREVQVTMRRGTSSGSGLKAENGVCEWIGSRGREKRASGVAAQWRCAVSDGTLLSPIADSPKGST